MVEPGERTVTDVSLGDNVSERCGKSKSFLPCHNNQLCAIRFSYTFQTSQHQRLVPPAFRGVERYTAVLAVVGAIYVSTVNGLPQAPEQSNDQLVEISGNGAIAVSPTVRCRGCGVGDQVSVRSGGKRWSDPAVSVEPPHRSWSGSADRPAQLAAFGSWLYPGTPCQERRGP